MVKITVKITVSCEISGIFRLCITSAPAAVTYYYATAYGVAKAASRSASRASTVLYPCANYSCKYS